MQPRIAISACTMIFLQVDPLGTVFMYLQTYFKQKFHMHVKGPSKAPQRAHENCFPFTVFLHYFQPVLEA